MIELDVSDDLRYGFFANIYSPQKSVVLAAIGSTGGGGGPPGS